MLSYFGLEVLLAPSVSSPEEWMALSAVPAVRAQADHQEAQGYINGYPAPAAVDPAPAQLPCSIHAIWSRSCYAAVVGTKPLPALSASTWKMSIISADAGSAYDQCTVLKVGLSGTRSPQPPTGSYQQLLTFGGTVHGWGGLSTDIGANWLNTHLSIDKSVPPTVKVPIWQPGDVAIIKYDPIIWKLTMFHKRFGCFFSIGGIPPTNQYLFVAARGGRSAVEVRVSQPSSADLQLFNTES